MACYSCFLSVVTVVRNQSGQIERYLRELSDVVSDIAADYELIVVDNSSSDDSVAVLKRLTSPTGIQNLQVYALTKEVESDIASWVGVENALGDFVSVVDFFCDDIEFISVMLDEAVKGSDVVFASNNNKKSDGFFYSVANKVFHGLYSVFNGVHLTKEAPPFRILSKRVINFILQHPQPTITYRHMPATGGFAKTYLCYDGEATKAEPKHFLESVDKGMRLLVSTTRAPMRLVTWLSMFGAAANLLYSIYVVLIGIFKANVAPGWISFSLQLSGMFFLISLVLLVLGEYILNMASLSNEGPNYHVAQEFTSSRMTRTERLNIEEVQDGEGHRQGLDEEIIEQ